MWVTGHRAPRVSACLIRCESRCGGLLGITYTVRWATLYPRPTCHSRNERESSLAGPSPAQGEMPNARRWAAGGPSHARCGSLGCRPPMCRRRRRGRAHRARPATNSGCACAGRGESCPACPRFWMPSRRVTRAPLQDRQLEATTAHSTPGTSLHLDSLDRAPARFNRARPCRADAEMHEATNVFDGTPSTPAVSLCYHARTARIL